jgi:hypothetical protein
MSSPMINPSDNTHLAIEQVVEMFYFLIFARQY